MNLALAARTYLGVPFRHQGRNPAIGIDCIGLLVLAARDAAMPVDERRVNYSKDPHDGLLEQHLVEAFGPPIPASQMQADDVVAIDYAGAVRHLGIIGEDRDGNLTLIHTSQGIVGKVVEHAIDAKWRGRIRAVFRPRLAE